LHERPLQKLSARAVLLETYRNVAIAFEEMQQWTAVFEQLGDTNVTRATCAFLTI